MHLFQPLVKRRRGKSRTYIAFAPARPDQRRIDVKFHRAGAWSRKIRGSNPQPLTRPSVSDTVRFFDQLIRRVNVARAIEGGAIGIALWCILFAFQLLPGDAAGTSGVSFFLVAGMAIGLTRFHRWLIGLLVVAAGITVVVTQSSLSNFVASRWVREDQYPDSGVAAVVVLSAALKPDSAMSADALDHLITGLELVRAGKARLLVTTTVQHRFPAGFVSSEIDQSRIIGLLGEATPWIRTPPGVSTRDEAVASARLLFDRGIRQLAVVTSPMHTRRACAAFEAVGFVVTCLPARSRTTGGRDPGSWPADRLKVFGDWVYEVFATAKYRANGWLATPQAGLAKRTP